MELDKLDLPASKKWRNEGVVKAEIYGVFVLEHGGLKVDEVNLIVKFPDVRAALGLDEAAWDQMLSHYSVSYTPDLITGQIVA